MMLFSKLYAVALTAAVAACPLVAMAGPCSADIASLNRQLGGMPGLGAPLSGNAAGSESAKAGSMDTGNATGNGQQRGATLAGGGSPGTVGGVSGTAVGAKNAVANGEIATSDQDVRSQSIGKPTAAQTALTGGSSSSTTTDERTSEAKMTLQKAVDLNAQGDSSCAAQVAKARSLMSKN